MGAAINAILATHSVAPFTSMSAGGPLDINARIVTPKPTPPVVNASAFEQVYIDTNSLSRKHAEISKLGVTRANLLYYDRDGIGYVALRGNASMCSEACAQREWWDGWKAFYPLGKNTSFYSLIKFVPDWMEIVHISSPVVSAGRPDWTPVSLRRASPTRAWTVEVPPGSSPPPAPPAPPTSWVCSVCAHVYDPKKDDPSGQSLPFEKLPETWVCPVCGAPKSAYKKQVREDGSEVWAHE
jgi:rubredoxin/general stress protein 26